MNLFLKKRVQCAVINMLLQILVLGMSRYIEFFYHRKQILNFCYNLVS